MTVLPNAFSSKLVDCVEEIPSSQWFYDLSSVFHLRVEIYSVLVI